MSQRDALPDEIKECTDMSADLCKMLHDTFEPIVLDVIKEDINLRDENFTALGLATSVMEIEEGWHYAFQVHLTKALSIDELESLVGQLSLFSTYGEGPGSVSNEVWIAGEPWTLGDGDDVLAVMFQNDAFSIWVRMLK